EREFWNRYPQDSRGIRQARAAAGTDGPGLYRRRGAVSRRGADDGESSRVVRNGGERCGELRPRTGGRRDRRAVWPHGRRGGRRGYREPADAGDESVHAGSPGQVAVRWCLQDADGIDGTAGPGEAEAIAAGGDGAV